MRAAFGLAGKSAEHGTVGRRDCARPSGSQAPQPRSPLCISDTAPTQRTPVPGRQRFPCALFCEKVLKIHRSWKKIPPNRSHGHLTILGRLSRAPPNAVSGVRRRVQRDMEVTGVVLERRGAGRCAAVQGTVGHHLRVSQAPPSPRQGRSGATPGQSSEGLEEGLFLK